MSDEDAMLLYARLASLSARRQQPQGRVRFLILTGMAATRAGWPEVAARCHDLIVANAPRHLVNGHASFADALRDDKFVTFARQVERFCPVERAEHLLCEIDPNDATFDVEGSAGETVLQWLADPAID